MLTGNEESLPIKEAELDHLAGVANRAVDAAGEIIRRHYLAWGNEFDVSNAMWTSIAIEAETAMITLIQTELPSHTVYGKQSGWSNCSGSMIPEFVWVLDPINGTVDGLLPTFGSSIAVVHNGRPVFGCINNPITRIKTLGRRGTTTRNGDRVRTRSCESLETAYVDIKEPEYSGDAKDAYGRLAYKVGETFFGGECVAYTELAAGMLQVVVDCDVDPYVVLGLIPIVEGAGGIITDWEGNQLSWQPSPESSLPYGGFKIVAAADLKMHQLIISELS